MTPFFLKLSGPSRILLSTACSLEDSEKPKVVENNRFFKKQTLQNQNAYKGSSVQDASRTRLWFCAVVAPDAGRLPTPHGEGQKREERDDAYIYIYIYIYINK